MQGDVYKVCAPNIIMESGQNIKLKIYFINRLDTSFDLHKINDIQISTITDWQSTQNGEKRENQKSKGF